MKNNKLFIPFPNYQFLGGPATFMGNLRAYLDRKGIAWHTNRSRARDMFINAGFKQRYVILAKLRGGRIIQRLDGIRYPEKHGKAYKKKNRTPRFMYRYLSDFVIFQSHYSRKQVQAMFGALSDDKHTIIYNGVNKHVFYPGKKPQQHRKFVFVTTGNFRNADMIEPVIHALDKLQSHYNFQLLIAGKIHRHIHPFMNRNYIEYAGELDANGVAEVLQSGHCFVYSHLNPPCPNSVLEAISTGLPVLGFDSGAMRELLPFATELLAPVNNKIFQSYHEFNHELLAKKLALCMDQYKMFREKALAHSHWYDFEDTGSQYLNVFRQIMRI